MAKTSFKKQYEVRDRDGNRHGLFAEQKEADDYVRHLTEPLEGVVPEDENPIPRYTIGEVRALLTGDSPGDEKGQYDPDSDDK